jgi:hypothetical protein
MLFSHLQVNPFVCLNSAQRTLKHSFPENGTPGARLKGMTGMALETDRGLTDVVSYLTVRVKFVVCANVPDVPVTAMV